MKSKNVAHILIEQGNQYFEIDGSKLYEWLMRRGWKLAKPLSEKSMEEKRIIDIVDSQCNPVGAVSVLLRQPLGK